PQAGGTLERDTHLELARKQHTKVLNVSEVVIGSQVRQKLRVAIGAARRSVNAEARDVVAAGGVAGQGVPAVISQACRAGQVQLVSTAGQGIDHQKRRLVSRRVIGGQAWVVARAAVRSLDVDLVQAALSGLLISRESQSLQVDRPTE